MRRILSMSIVLMLLACAMAEAETRRALVIGIDDYLSPADNLAGAVNDAEAVASLLETPRFGFAAKDVVRLRDSDATRERILAEMRRLFLEASAAGDLAVLYVASHGAQMQNTLSPEQDKTDETIVPHPRPKRADIRDKELGRILEEAARKGVRVTAILDSCHSGSMERGLSRHGRMRALAPDPGAVAADPSVPDPVAAGALMLSAAQDFQTAAETVDDSGQPHGAFTIALLQALREAPVDEPAAQFLLRVRAILQRDGSVQEPALSAGSARLRDPLFGGAGMRGRLAVAVRNVSGSVVELQGGKAIGLAPGAFLARREVQGLGPVGLKAKTVELTRSRADVVEGNAQTVKAGQLFDVKKWAALPGASLRIHVPPGRPAREVRSAADRLGALKQSSSLRWVEDPAQLSPTHVLVAQQQTWLLRFPDGREVNLGSAPAAAEVERALTGTKGVAGRAAPCDTMPCLYVRLPPATELLEKITVGKAADDAVRRVDDPQSHYVLAGRVQGDTLQYAWVLAAPPARPGEKAPPLLPLPPRSTWIELGDDPAVAGASLEELVLRIGRARDWLTLESPPDTGAFPYRLALVNRQSNDVVGSGAVVHKGETYNLQLRADPASLKTGGIERRYVYVISVDNAGSVQVLYPRPGVTETRFPVVAEGEDLPATQPIGGSNVGFRVVEPFGKDTYILVATREAIANLIDIEQEAVMRGRPIDRGAESALSRLLRNTGARTRGVGSIDDVDPDWNIQRLEVESRP
jgi:hypothetical protein